MSKFLRSTGPKTKTMRFVVRVQFPWDCYTERLVAARKWSGEQLEMLTALGKSMQVRVDRPDFVVVGLDLANLDSKLFKLNGPNPSMVALLRVTLNYSTLKFYSLRDLQPFLNVTINSAEYPEDRLSVMILGNGQRPRLREHDMVRLKDARPADGLRYGAEGTVVHVFRTPDRAFQAEFADADGRTIASVPLRESEVDVTWRIGDTPRHQVTSPQAPQHTHG